SLNPANFLSYLSTYIIQKDLDGILKECKAFEHNIKEFELKQILEQKIEEIVLHHSLLPINREIHLARFNSNLEHIRKLDKNAYDILNKKGFPEDFYKNSLNLSDIVYFKEDNEWKKISSLTFDNRFGSDYWIKNESNALAIQCLSIEQFAIYMSGLHTSSPKFLKNLSYIIIDYNLLSVCMAVLDLSVMIACDYVFRFINLSHFENSFSSIFLKQNLSLPGKLIILNDKDREFYHKTFFSAVKDLEKIYFERLKELRQRLIKFYPDNFYLSLPEKIFKKSLRILFVTSRYTTYLQHCSKQLEESFNREGYIVKTLKEAEDEPCGQRGDIYYETLCEFYPDIIFCICHLKYEDDLPESIPYICWIQDLLPIVASGKYVSKMTKNDIVLTEIHTPEELMAIGYKDVQHFPVHVNDYLFNGNPEDVFYDCDISHVSHAPSNNPFDPNNYPELTRYLFQIISEQIKQPFSSSYNFVTMDDFINLLKPIVEAKLPKSHESVYRRIRSVIANYICKTTVLKWIIGAGYREVNLWGRGWSEMQEFSQFAKGIVSHGTELSHVYNKSKINLNLTHGATMHHKVFEVIASGGFLMTGYIPPEKDEYQIEKFLAPGEGYVFFKGKDDLLKKIDYYLKNDEERIKIVKRGIAKVLENYATKSGVQKILDIVNNRFS
ncbi:MAG: glycosyltransferase, partial [Desulfobacterales bacterium]|nr:glycosyltransferase [Desulfobacterales bacterium]